MACATFFVSECCRSLLAMKKTHCDKWSTGVPVKEGE